MSGGGVDSTSVSSARVRIMEWTREDLLKLRQVLQVHPAADIETMLVKYTEMVELFSACFPHWPVSKRVDWSVAVAMAPDW